MSTYLIHADRSWKNHKYISKKRGPGGKWIYKYKEAVGLNARENAKKMSARSDNAEMANIKARYKYKKDMRRIGNDRYSSTMSKSAQEAQATSEYQANKMTANKAKLRADKAIREYQNTPIGKLETAANKGKKKLAKILGAGRGKLRRVG